MNLNKLTEYTANQTKKETEKWLAEQKSKQLMQVVPTEYKPMPIPTKPTEYKPLPIEKKPKKKRKYFKGFSIFLIGLLIGASIMFVLAVPYTVDKCEPFVTEASKKYYAMGAAFIINKIQETGEIPYFDEGEIKTTPIEQLKAGGAQ